MANELTSIALKDIYCDTLLSISVDERAAQRVFGCTKKVFLSKLQSDISEVYSKKTAYDIQDFQSGTAALEMLKKCCTKNVLFRGKISDERLENLYCSSLKILDQIAENDEQVDVEELFTAAANVLRIATNSALWMKRGEKKDIEAVTADIDIEQAMAFLEEGLGSEQACDTLKVKNHRNENQKKRSNLTGRLLCIAKWALSAVTFLSGGIAVSGIFIPVPQEIEASGFIDRVKSWYRYDVLKEKIPESFAEKWMPITQQAGMIFGITVGLIFVGLIVMTLYRWQRKKKLSGATQQWCEQRYIRQMFLATAVRMKELEEWDDGWD